MVDREAWCHVVLKPRSWKRECESPGSCLNSEGLCWKTRPMRDCSLGRYLISKREVRKFGSDCYQQRRVPKRSKEVQPAHQWRPALILKKHLSSTESFRASRERSACGGRPQNPSS